MDLAARLHALINGIGKPTEAEQVRRLREAVGRRLAGMVDVDEESTASAIAGGVSDPPVAGYLAELLARLLAAEGYFALPREDPDSTTAELWALRDTLKIQERILADFNRPTAMVVDFARSEARRVGKECVSTCRSRWSPYH